MMWFVCFTLIDYSFCFRCVYSGNQQHDVLFMQVPVYGHVEYNPVQFALAVRLLMAFLVYYRQQARCAVTIVRVDDYRQHRSDDWHP